MNTEDIISNAQDFERWLAECKKEKAYYLDWGSDRMNYALKGMKGGMSLLVGGVANFGKPVDESTPILMGDGSYKPLREIKIGDEVITHRGRARRVLNVYTQGKLECLRIRTRTGREVVAALDHPFLTPGGWKNAKDLTVSDKLALVRNVSAGPNDVRFGPEDARLAGYFIGDGHVTMNDRSFNVTIAYPDREGAADILNLIGRKGFKGLAVERTRRVYVSEGIRDWLIDSGIVESLSDSRRAPDWVFRLDNRGIAHFLASFFACNGTVLDIGRTIVLKFYSAERGALEGIQRLLLRLGINSVLSSKHRSYLKRRGHPSWRLSISDPEDIARFAEVIPLTGKKRAAIASHYPRRGCFPGEFIADKITSINPEGLVPCRCLEVEEDHTFLANDFVVHNSQVLTFLSRNILARNRDAIVVDFTMDDPKSKRITQYIAAMAHLDMNTVDFMNNVIDPDKIDRFVKACNEFKSWVDSGRLLMWESGSNGNGSQSDIKFIISKTEEIRRENPSAKVVVILDSLNDIEAMVKSDDPYVRSESVTKELNRLIVRTDSVLIASTHLRKNGGRRPTLEDLKGNNFLAYSAKVVIGIHNDMKLNKGKAKVFWTGKKPDGEKVDLPIVEAHFLKSKVSDFNSIIVFQQWPSQARLKEAENQETYLDIIYGGV